MGKSALAFRLAHTGAQTSRRVIWVSLTNAPTVDELLHGLLSLFPDRDTRASGTSIEQLIACLTGEACFVVLDNLEVLLDSHRFSNEFRPGYTAESVYRRADTWIGTIESALVGQPVHRIA
ncbi:hypothetical protein [Streptomyces sp. NBC_01264]|uniref:hypothetical protein n=1 Tax=Streptomyces sp. NBC_01264 TaxID=2903804 RepID=UPI0022586BDD|nr:hypothetical protein [Streptomyces sp. NBC_01264]MCX4777622.1 hypothetical protein [Streptomyces sp. NBC_01264]